MVPKPNSNRGLRIVLLSIGGVLLLALLCCLCTLAVGWYTGDYFVDQFMQLVR
ncbi:MAG TPA: hypothetical protein VJ182_03685 [Anaerolineales bacterium]|nr:hypothetical protein [Anaerolineales bacterium]